MWIEFGFAWNKRSIAWNKYLFHVIPLLDAWNGKSTNVEQKWANIHQREIV
jgi:hypothetical protein